jgi:malonyl-CoA/methylmalonyl-CoA synthetase
MICWDRDFATLAHRHADRVLVRDASRSTTYGESFARAAGLADHLAREGVGPGVAVATLVPNGIDAVWASLGVTLSGAAEVPLNVQHSAAERAHCLALASVEHIVTNAEYADALPAGARLHRLETIEAATIASLRWIRPPPGAHGRILFTSGTTGEPKGVVHTHHGRWLANLLLRAHLPFTPRPGDDLLLMTPFCHGASLLTYAWMATGASVTLLPGLMPDVVLPLLRAGRVNSLFAPPTVLAKLMSLLGNEQLLKVRAIFCGTATLPRELYRATRRMFGPVVRITYGMTEIFNPITVLEASEVDRTYGDDNGSDERGACLGWPASGVELEIRDEQGRAESSGHAGEIYVRAAHAFAGYLTRSGFEPRDPGQLHATGDVGTVDERGLLYLAGRMHDVIKSGGYKVAPQQIEEQLAQDVTESTVSIVGLPSQYWGEIIVGVVEDPPPGWRERRFEHLDTLSSHKRPRLLVALPELPRNAIGKINRRAIVEQILTRYTLVDGAHPRLVPRDQ